MKIHIIILSFLLAFIFCTNLSSQELAVINEVQEIEDLLDVKVFTAAKYEQSMRDAPASISVITSDDIRNHGWQTLDEALFGQAGFFSRNDRDYVYIGIRGFERPTSYNNKILQLIDGHTINENIYSSPFFSNELCLDMHSIERIEIVRGPGSSLYGASAMLGVINVITKDSKQLDGLHASGNIGSWSNTSASLSYGNHSDNGLCYTVSGKIGYMHGPDVYFPEFDNIQYNNGKAEYCDWERYWGVRTKIWYSNFFLLAHFSTRDKGIPTGAWNMTFNDNRAHSSDSRGYVELKYENNFAKNLFFMGKAYFDMYDSYGLYPYEIVEYDANYGRWVGLESQINWDILSNNRFTAGFEFKNNFRSDIRIWDEEKERYYNNFPFNMYSGYVQDQWQFLDDFSLTVGLRYDNYTNSESSFSPRVALLHYFSKNTVLKYLFGGAFRPPNIYELNYNDGITQKNNPDLKPEKIQTHEIVCNQKINENLFVTASVYYYLIDNLIDNIIDTSDNRMKFINVDRASALGTELQINADFGHNYTGYISYSYQYAKDNSDNKLSNSPSHIIKLGTVIKLIDGLRFSGEANYETERITPLNTKTDAYCLCNLALIYCPDFGGKGSMFAFLSNLNLTLKVNNVFNTPYKLPGGNEHRQYSIPQLERNVTLGVEYKL